MSEAATTRQATIGLVLDGADPEELAAFWGAALGVERLGAAGQYVMLASSTGAIPKLLLQRVEEPKSTKNRMHLDIETPDVDSVGCPASQTQNSLPSGSAMITHRLPCSEPPETRNLSLLAAWTGFGDSGYRGGNHIGESDLPD